MSKLQQLMKGEARSKFGQTFAAACMVASTLGVGLTASGEALADGYNQRAQTSGVMPVKQVNILSVHSGEREQVDQQSSINVSRVVGGAVGGLAGNQIGKGNGKTLATIIGAAFGQAVGNNVDKQMGTRIIKTVEFMFTIQGDRSGQRYIVVQDLYKDPAQTDGLSHLAGCEPGGVGLLVNGREIARCLVTPSNYAQQQDKQQPQVLREYNEQVDGQRLLSRDAVADILNNGSLLDASNQQVAVKNPVRSSGPGF